MSKIIGEGVQMETRNNSISQTIGTKIKALRLKAGLNQPELLAGKYSDAYLSRVEHDHVYPSPDFLDFLASRLGVSVEELVEETKPAKPKVKKASKEAQILELMNAHVALQASQPEVAGRFLKKIELEALPENLLGRYYFILGEAEAKLKEYESALTNLELALKLFTENPLATPLEIERVRNWIGLVYYNQGKHQQAVKIHLKCLDAILDGRLTDTIFRMQLYRNLGNEYHFLGDQKQALGYYQEAVKLAETGENDADRAGIYWGIGLVYRSDNNLARTKLYLHKSATLYETIGDLNLAATVYGVLGNTMTERKEYDQAEKVLTSAISLAERLQDDYACHVAYTNLAYCYYSQGKFEEAGEKAHQGLLKAKNISNVLGMADSLAQQAEIKIATACKEEGFALFEEAIRLLEETDYIDNLRKICYRYSTALEQSGYLSEAIQMLRKAYLYQNQKGLS